ncbi:hypothetical protein LTR84_002750 [Exophiala bonariae]|uniref:Uncharacterized protein n=1 Tax=Exophiala bonariae TaxID=1690606 RepID=A0AAV9NBD7_9EURO|nr:hypothetical protein LTR84_002750 [Exophiala bonariae]
MTTLLDNTGLPRWVYILLIVVGSVLILVTIAILLRCWFVRQRAKTPEYNGLTGATRRMTVRRGRMVPTSQHLSLTGSRFGMRQFGLLADNESTMTGRRSPFEWWNGMIDRSQSRQDSISQMEAGSIFTRPSSRATTIATRKDYFAPTPTTRTPEKTKEPSMRTTELTIPSPSPSPTPSSHRPSINFSRSFAQKVPSSPLTQRSQHTLSRIEESSPPTTALSNSPKPPNRSSYFAAIHPVDSTPLSRPVPESRPATTSNREPSTSIISRDQPLSSQSPLPYDQGRNNPTSFLLEPIYQDSRRLSGPALTSSHYVEDIKGQLPLPPRPKTSGDSASRTPRGLSQNKNQNLVPPKLPKTLAFPKPVKQTTSRRQEVPQNSSMYPQMDQSTSNLSKRASTASQKDSAKPTSKSTSRKSSMSIGPSGVVYESQLPDYWSSRTDLQDLTSTLDVIGSESRASFNSTRRSLKNVGAEGERDNIIGVVTVPGKNNRVLRKKSLRNLQPQKGSPTK